MESTAVDASSRDRQHEGTAGSAPADGSNPSPAKADVVEALKASRTYEKFTIPPLPSVAQLDVWMLSV
eukprot:10662114-Lingulodinium_polyedra.AAC.1